MGSRSDFPGVERHRAKLRVVFQIDGQRRRETLDLADVPANWPKAHKLREEILRKINLGTFVYADYFPGSVHATASGGAKTFKDVAQEWLDLQFELAKSTIESYERILNVHWLPEIGKKAMVSITPGQLRSAVKRREFKTPKSRNNCVSVLRLVFAYAVGEKYVSDNPAAGLEHLDTEQPVPDPFSFDEMTAILGYLREHAKAQTYHYFWFAFHTGLRTSELLQLQWGKVDWNRREVRVDEAYVRNQVKTTKTRRSRDVELTSEATAALTAQKAHTFLAGAHVFLNPNTGDSYYNQQAPGLAFNAALKKLGIRHRPAYNTRHTFATINLMSGANPYWVSQQLGHASLEMTLKVYSRWISGADQGRERDRVEQYLKSLGGKSGGIEGVTGGKRG